jgi:propionyl-CoA carboxylase alpha chain
LGIPTVAVYASNDAGSKHVMEADEAVCLGSSGTAYTDLPSLVKAIEATGADAVHPGYGFLSENADFANAVQELGVVWLGPPAQAILDMGCKLRSKDIAREADVAIIPGCDDGALESVEEALALMDSENPGNNGMEYPVLLKAAAGGGGKGMRICRNDQELIEGYPLAKSEGLKFFADGRLLLEQYLEDPHHIEFQVICSKRERDDSDPTVDVAIFAERECSVQRRNQKVVEESPSCLLTEKTRRHMMEQTALLCQTVGYEGAGTVEWLVVDSKSMESAQKFYFLEMNTRLQVEHPITEAVSHNVDLVEAMLEVGSGRGLPRDWYDRAEVVETSNDNDGKMLVMPWKGHSIEGRIYAEDPLRGYLPSVGPLVPYKEPTQALSVDDGTNSGQGIDDSSSYLRLDSGVVEGHVGTLFILLRAESILAQNYCYLSLSFQTTNNLSIFFIQLTVTPFYDPMLSKIISYASTRKEAIKVLSEGLDAYVIEGVKHNAKLVQAVLRHPSFQSGRTQTSFLEEEIPDFSEYQYNDDFNGASQGSLLSASEEEELAAAVAVISRLRDDIFGRPPVVGGAGNDDSRTVVIRLDGMFGNTDAFSVTIMDERKEAHVRRMGKEARNDESYRVIAMGGVDLDPMNYLANVVLDGAKRIVQVVKEQASGELKVQMHGAEYAKCLVQSQREFELSQHMLPPVIEDTSNFVMSPMPGTLISFSGGVTEGNPVKEGQELCVVEAMKMQNIIRAPREGIVSKLCVDEGAALATDQVILEFEVDDEEETSAA